MKIKASAMQFAILVSVIIAVLLGSFLTLSHTQRLFSTQSTVFLNTIDAANFGIRYGLHSKNSFRDSILLESNLINTTIKRKYWGGFTLLESTATVKSKAFKKMALVGSEIPYPNTCLYISESKIPLVLVRNTKIEGTAYISSRGIKSGSMAGHYFNGDELVKGAVYYDAENLPSLDKQWEVYIKHLIDYIPDLNDEVIPIQDENSNSFFNDTNFIFDSDQLVLSEKFIGNIIIKSEKAIRITSQAILTDVTIIAPTIIIENGFKGNASFIASESLIVEEDVSLSYPSALVVVQDEEYIAQDNKEISIIISKNTFIGGIVISIPTIKKAQGTRSKVNIDIKSLAVIEGQIYCKGNTQLSGTVKGSVYTNRFVAKKFGSIYVNHIYNGAILANDLHPKFSGLPFRTSNNSIVKWLY